MKVMKNVKQSTVQNVGKSPAYLRLVKERNRLGWSLTLVVMLVYYGFIYLVGFQKEYMAEPLFAEGVTSLSVALGLGVILTTIILTGLYVWVANARFDSMISEIKQDAT